MSKPKIENWQPIINDTLATQNETWSTEISQLLQELAKIEIDKVMESWENFGDYQELTQLPNYTEIGTKTKSGLSFRTLARRFTQYIGLDNQLDDMAENFWDSNTSSPITYRKPDDRKRVEGNFDNDPENVNLSSEDRKKKIDRLVSIEGIKRAIELTVMTTAYDCYKFNQGNNQAIQDRLMVYMQQDARYVRRVHNKHFEGIELAEKDTKLWSIPFEWNVIILRALEKTLNDNITKG